MIRTLLAVVLTALIAAPAPSQELRVGVPERPPFAEAVPGGHQGLVVDLWRLTAEALDLSYDYVDVPRGGATDALASGRADLVLAVDATALAEEAMDLTHPVLAATLGVVEGRRSRIWATITAFASWRFLQILAGLSALLLIVGAAIWALERRRNGEQFHRDALRGLGDGFWWAGVTLTTIGYGDKAPVTVLGRAVAMLWMLIGLAVSAALTAAIVTLADADRDLAQDLSGLSVAAIEGSTAARHLSSLGAEVVPEPDLAGVLDALSREGVDAAAAPAPALRHAVERDGTGLRVRTTRLDPQYVAIALPEGSDLREPLNRTLLAILASDAGRATLDRHLAE